ncbi:hypothetical protein N9S81_00175 [bacterium]|nr:hypothetical protein [bacterium]
MHIASCEQLEDCIHTQLGAVVTAYFLSVNHRPNLEAGRRGPFQKLSFDIDFFQNPRPENKPEK